MPSSAQNSIRHRVGLRPATMPVDEPFLRELYFSTREDLYGLFSDPAQMQGLLSMQYTAQALSYDRQFPEARHEIVLLDDQPVGRMIVDLNDDAMWIVDIALLPNSRNQGIGTILLNRRLAECSDRRVPCFLQVLGTNPARSLYERSGFVIQSDDGVRLLMKWAPQDNDR